MTISQEDRTIKCVTAQIAAKTYSYIHAGNPRVEGNPLVIAEVTHSNRFEGVSAKSRTTLVPEKCW